MRFHVSVSLQGGNFSRGGNSSECWSRGVYGGLAFSQQAYRSYSHGMCFSSWLPWVFRSYVF